MLTLICCALGDHKTDAMYKHVLLMYGCRHNQSNHAIRSGSHCLYFYYMRKSLARPPLTSHSYPTSTTTACDCHDVIECRFNSIYKYVIWNLTAYMKPKL